MIKKYIKIFTTVLAVLAISCATAFAAGNITINTKRAYDVNSATVSNLRTTANINKVRGFEVNVTNNTDDPKNLSMIVVKYSNNICNGVVIADVVNIDAHSTDTISAPCTISTNKVKCIIVEKTINGLFPISTQTLEMGRNGWSVQ